MYVEVCRSVSSRASLSSQHFKPDDNIRERNSPAISRFVRIGLKGLDHPNAVDNKRLDMIADLPFAHATFSRAESSLPGRATRCYFGVLLRLDIATLQGLSQSLFECKSSDWLSAQGLLTGWELGGDMTDGIASLDTQGLCHGAPDRVSVLKMGVRPTNSRHN